MKLFNIVILSFTMGVFAAGCTNTLDGAGRDIEHAGEKIQDTF